MIVGIGLTRRNLFLGLAIAIIISDSIIFFAEIKSKELYSNWIISINATVAATLAILVIYNIRRSKVQHRHEHNSKAHFALAIGLSLWLCADIIWATYQIILEIVPPVPSPADFIWLTAYGFFAYYLYATYDEFHKKLRFSRRVLIYSVIGSTIFLGYIVAITLSLSTLTTTRGITMFAVIIAYPILDAILMIPAISILVNFRNEPIWFTPWICESLGIFLMAVSDSWFALVVLTSLVQQFWLSALFFAAHYLVIAAGLIWYIKFLLTMSTNNNNNNRPLSKVVTAAASSNGIPKTIDSSGNNNKKLSSYKKKNTLRFITTGAIAAIIIIVVVVYYYLPDSTLSFLSFTNNNANSEIVLAAPAGSKQTVTLGALLPLTGISSSLGESEEAALKIAFKDINENFSKNHSNSRLELVIEDTETNPEVSLEKLEHLIIKGIRIVIGPATSAELEATQDYANSHGVLLLSPSSTAPSLAIPGNNVFRFVPDDTHQAQATSELMWNDGIRIVIPFWRTDVYGNDLVKIVKQNFQQIGGRVEDGIGYTPNTGDFFASLNRINFIVWDQDLRSLSSKLNQAIAAYGANRVAVYLVAFDEVVPIFIQAQNHPALSLVKWYGSDGSVLNNKLVKNDEAAKFAVKTDFLSPIYGVENDNNENFKHITSQIQENIGRAPRSYASVAYDALWVAALAENDTKATNNINYLKNTLIHIANSYNGITGNTKLNQNGDRKYGDYDFWAVVRNTDNSTHDTFTWKRVSKYRLEEVKTHLTPEIASTR
ncbi:MAG: penicillin-binding protein activator [Nitrososphaeraceae archaeon]|nr:penicillin-binding protein activator [Nitrososphaeraceae archaeon]MBV9666798.1 penicillin-binding protein activator [Nitrososphaeraceae archaeon]